MSVHTFGLGLDKAIDRYKSNDQTLGLFFQQFVFYFLENQMYSPFNLSTKRDFVAQELAREYLSFPDEIDKAYSEVYQWLSDFMPNFDERGAPSNLDLTGNEEVDRVNVGREFTYLLPGHMMKVYQTLLFIESEALSHNTSSLLDKPYVSIIDVGCGGGTATIALISLILNHQKYRLSKNVPIFPVIINCFGIDVNDRALKIYGKFLEKCTAKVKPHLIEVRNTRMFPGTLPENLARIIEWLDDNNHTQCVLIALSNVIRSFTNQYTKDSKRRNLFEVIGLGRFLPDGWGVEVGIEEVRTLKMILRGNVDQIVTVSIGAYSHKQTDEGKLRQCWQNEMTAFHRTLHSKLANDDNQVSITPIKQRHLRMVNPSDSFHCKHIGRRCSFEIEYDSGFTIIDNGNYLKDSDWQKILDPNNLLLAWARVRNALSYEMLEDTLEVRLFEANIEERLNKLQSEILAYQWKLLNVEEMCPVR